MRILHTSDWHLGRTLAQESLLDDQAHLLEQVFDAVVSGEVDTLIIAGDIFDRPNPRREAVALFNDFLRRIYAETSTAIVAIAGNHDAPERVSFNSALQDPRRVLIRGPLNDRANPLVLNDQHGPVAFSALPYSEVFAAREAFGELAIASPADVLAAQVAEARQHVPTGARWVVAAHVFVEGGSTTETERPLTQVGGIETVPAGTFDGAAYVALGHLHRAQSAGSQHIRYCGSWMGFGFDEAGESKTMTLVDLDAAGAVTFEQLPLVSKRPLRVINGRLEEVLQLGRNEGTAAAACLVKAILTDEGALVDAIGQLRAVWPHVLQIERTQRISLTNGDGRISVADRRDPVAMVGNFLEVVRGDRPDAIEEKVLADALMIAETEKD
jgi:exonuclease SbcD